MKPTRPLDLINAFSAVVVAVATGIITVFTANLADVSEAMQEQDAQRQVAIFKILEAESVGETVIGLEGQFKTLRFLVVNKGYHDSAIELVTVRVDFGGRAIPPVDGNLSVTRDPIADGDEDDLMIRSGDRVWFSGPLSDGFPPRPPPALAPNAVTLEVFPVLGKVATFTLHDV